MARNFSISSFVPKEIDPFGILQSSMDVQFNWMCHPEILYPEVMDFYNILGQINLQVCRRCMGEQVKDPVLPNIYDERFHDDIWFENPIADFTKEYYLLYTHWMLNRIFETPKTTDLTRRRAGFWVRQFFNIISPTNSFFLNPRALARFFETGGKSLMNGINMFMEDLVGNDITMVDKSQFEVGKNIATTPGNVVFRNELFELIQYAPTTNKVHATPILIVPPWINKYYILDLNSKKSMIQYLIKQGYTVFIMSWRNPPKEMCDTGFEDYLMKGILQAAQVTKEICKSGDIHCVGYCVGGTALTTLLAWLNSKQKEVADNPIGHFSLLCTLLSFEDAGDIDVFIDEASVAAVEKMMSVDGFLDGKKMEQTFRLLRSNSLIWSYFTSHYLLGESPKAFDVLYWNTDSTRLPAKMHSFYLRNFYLGNKLAKKGALKIKGEKLDLNDIKQPIYAVGTEQDHITPWKETFKSMQLTGGKRRYILATSGHIVGVLSAPVDPPKRRYWAGSVDAKATPESWVAVQEKITGSWWEDWDKWLGKQCGTLQLPPKMGSSKYKVICAAPGTYVHEK